MKATARTNIKLSVQSIVAIFRSEKLDTIYGTTSTLFSIDLGKTTERR